MCKFRTIFYAWLLFLFLVNRLTLICMVMVMVICYVEIYINIIAFI